MERSAQEKQGEQEMKGVRGNGGQEYYDISVLTHTQSCASLMRTTQTQQ